MKYVLDASVALKWVLPEADSDKAIALQEAAEQRVHELSAPDTLPVETAHALTRAERKRLLATPEVLVHCAGRTRAVSRGDGRPASA